MENNTAKKDSGISRPAFVILFTIFLTAITWLTTGQPIWANIPINVIIPIIILIKLDAVFFEKLKLSTLLVMRILILFVIFGKLDGELFVKINLIFLAINIMEATISDFRKGKYYNALSGLLLAITIIFLKGNWSVTAPRYTASALNKATGQHMMAATTCWVIVYTIWNWIFVTNEFTPAIALYHFAILGTPLVGMILFKNPGMWLMYRAYSLTTGGNIQIAKKDYLEEKLKSDKFAEFVKKTQTKGAQIAFMIINIVLLAAMVYMVYK